MYADLKKAGVEIIAINQADTAESIKKRRAEGNYTFPLAMSGSGANDAPLRYGVLLYPVNYVVDSKGYVVDAMVGFDEKRIRVALEKLGAKF